MLHTSTYGTKNIGTVAVKCIVYARLEDLNILSYSLSIRSIMMKMEIFKENTVSTLFDSELWMNLLVNSS